MSYTRDILDQGERLLAAVKPMVYFIGCLVV